MKILNHKSYILNQKKGFTFIEVLVVTSIIAVLATIGVVSYSSANIKARDGKRKADVEQIRAGLEMYRVDIGLYPAALASLSTTYINTLPTPPKAADCTGAVYNGCYTPAGDRKTYSLSIPLEGGGSYSTANP